MIIKNGSPLTNSVKAPFEKIHHFVATPSLSTVSNSKHSQKSPKNEKPKLKPLPASSMQRPFYETKSEEILYEENDPTNI